MKALLLLPFVIPSLASAATLATYKFTSTPYDAPVVDGVSGSSITYGTGLTEHSSTATFGTSGANALGLDHVGVAIPTSVDAAVTALSYFTFTLTPNAGESISLTSFSLRGNYAGNDRSANNIALQIDTGSGFSTAGTITLNTTGTTTEGNTHSFTLSGYDNLTSSVTFRVVMYDTDGVTWNSYTRLDDITLSGTVIPEPSLALFILSLSPLLASRRRRG